MHTRALRRLTLGFASILALASAARAGDVVYPQLNTATTVLDTDLIATWRASGPLTKVNASVLVTYLQPKFNADYLQIGNNLSDLGNAGTARNNLGLGTAATQNTGTSGMALCLMNQNCTWSGTELFQAKITTGTPSAAGAMFNLAPGAAPTSPINGDVWMTSSGEFERVNGATQQVAYLTSNVASANFATSASSATTATTATNATQLGGVPAASYVQNNSGTYSINISGTAQNSNQLGGVAASSYVQNSGTWGINITGNAATATNASQLNGDHTLRGNVSAGPGGDTWVNYSTPFVGGSVVVISGIGSNACYITAPALNGFNVHNPTGSTISVNWVAIGN